MEQEAYKGERGNHSSPYPFHPPISSTLDTAHIFLVQLQKQEWIGLGSYGPTLLNHCFQQNTGSAGACWCKSVIKHFISLPLAGTFPLMPGE